MSAMSLSQLLDYISIRLNGEKATGKEFLMNFIISDTGDKALVQVKNSVVFYWVNETSPDANVTIEMPRKTLEELALDPSVTPADVKITGDSAVFD